MKYAIKVYSRWEGRGGIPLYLGAAYSTREEADKEARRLVCDRCDVYDIYSFPDNYEWLNKRVGFVDLPEAL